MDENTPETAGLRGLVKSKTSNPRVSRGGRNTEGLWDWVNRQYSRLVERTISRIAHHDTALKFLTYVDAKPGVTYDELERALPVGRRQVKGIAVILRDLGLIVTESCPSMVFPKNDDMELVIKYILETLRPSLETQSRTRREKDEQPASPTETTSTTSSLKNNTLINTVGRRLRGKGGYPDRG